MSQHNLAGAIADFSKSENALVQERFLDGISRLIPTEQQEETLPSPSWPMLNEVPYHGLAG